MALPDPAVPAPDDASTVAWHAQAAADSARHLAVDWTHGLSDAEAAARLARHGPNLITQKPARPAWKRFADQLMQPLVLVLIATGLITGGLGESADASVIFGVVLVNAIIGYWQEAKAEGALAALARSVATPVTVRRSGHRRQLDAAGLVPGDVVVLAAGDRIPADLRLFHQRELHTDDSMLTGESQPVAKRIDPLAPGTLLAERVNMAYAGTTVVAGQGAGLVVGTGDATETGRIAGLIAAAPDLATPLTRKMATFSNWLLWAIGGFAALTFAVGLARGEALFDMFMAAVALAVGAIPEGLPAAVTVTLAIGVARMARRRAIIRHLPAVETLGSTTVICSDKTGTLTENAMTVRTVWCGGAGYAVGGHGYAPDGEITHDALPATIAGALRECLVAGALCNDAGLSREGQHWKITGDPTEAALLVAARKGGLDEHTLQALYPRRDELPFDASRQFMATIHAGEDAAVVYVKGALERLLPRCSDCLDSQGRKAPLDPASIEAAAHACAAQGMRVLLLAKRVAPASQSLTPEAIDGLTLLGLVGMIDPPRKAAIAAIRNCHSAGIRVKMITGDHAITALAIARQIGLVGGAGTDRQRTRRPRRRRAGRGGARHRGIRPRRAGTEAAPGARPAGPGRGGGDDRRWRQRRAGPQAGRHRHRHGLRRHRSRQGGRRHGADRRQLRQHRGRRRGGQGRLGQPGQVHHLDAADQFRRGPGHRRRDPVRRTLPITPLQILWINMTTAVLLGLPLAFEPIERGIMHRPPRRLETPVLDSALIRRIVLVSVLLLAGAFGLFLRELEQGRSLAEARTVAVNVFVMVEMLYLFNCRSLTRSFWSLGVFSNLWVWGGIGSMLALQLLLTYWPPLNRVFQTAPIGVIDWLEIVGFALCASLAIALEKRWTAARTIMAHPRGESR